MALGQSPATQRAATLRFTMQTDINAIRRTRREFQTFLEMSDAFERAQQLSGQTARLVAAGAKVEAEAVQTLNREFASMRNEAMQAEIANEALEQGLEETANSADIAAQKLSALTRQTRGFQDAESSISGLVRGVGRIPGVDPGSAILVAELAGAPRDLARLSESLGSMREQARAAFSAISGFGGLGLIGAIGALAAASLLATRRQERFIEQLNATIEGQQIYFDVIQEGTRASIAVQQAQNQIELDAALAKRDDAARQQQEAQLALQGQGRLASGAAQIPLLGPGITNITNPDLADALSAFNRFGKVFDEQQVEVERFLRTQESLTNALNSNEVAINSENENRKLLNAQLAEQLQQENEAAVARKQAFADAQPGLQRQRVSDFVGGVSSFFGNLAGGVGGALTGVGEGVTDLAGQRQKITDQIADIQFASSQRLARIGEALDAKRVEAAIRLAQKLETARRAFDERRLKAQENFQAAMSRLTRTFNRANLNSIAERDALANFLARQQREDAAADQQEQAARQLTQQKRTERERERIIRQGNTNTLRVALQSAQRQTSLEVQRARQNIAAKQQELQVLSIFRQRGLQEVGGFVQGALGLLSRLGSVSATQTVRSGTTSTQQVKNIVDKQIEQTFFPQPLAGSSAGTPF